MTKGELQNILKHKDNLKYTDLNTVSLRVYKLITLHDCKGVTK